MNNTTKQMLRSLKQFPVTSVLIIINTVMLIYTLITGGFTTTNLVGLGGLVPIAVREYGEYYRVITSMFLHGSIMHFIFNMYALFPRKKHGNVNRTI